MCMITQLMLERLHSNFDDFETETEDLAMRHP
jgi:hypothetical protein